MGENGARLDEVVNVETVNEVTGELLGEGRVEHCSEPCPFASRSDSRYHHVKLLEYKENAQNCNEPRWKDISNQILASCIAALSVVPVGLHMSYSAVLLPQLEDINSEFRITKSQSSWIASCLVLSTPVGSLISGPLSDKWGRKTANMLTCIPAFVAWVMIACSPSTTVVWLYFARILGGVGGGMTTTFIVYTSEICHEKYRAMMLSLNSVAVAIGILLITINAVHMSWRMMAGCYSLLSLITFFLIWLCTPESPHWLYFMSKNSNYRITTEKAIKWLNPNKEIYKRTLNQILATSRKTDGRTNIQEQDGKIKTQIKNSFASLMSPNVYLPLLLLMGLMMLQQLSGGYAIIFYTIHIFKKFSGNVIGGIDEYNALLILGIIRFLSSVVASILARIIKRKTLLYVSSFCMAISCISISVHQYCLQIYNSTNLTTKLNNESVLIENNLTTLNEHNNTSITHPNSYIPVLNAWIPIFCIFTIVSTGAIGLLNIPWTLIGEILPTSIRGKGTGFMISFAYVVLFAVIKIYPFLLDLLDIGHLFFIQGVVCLITIVYVFLFVPETLGKSLHEIENYFAK